MNKQNTYISLLRGINVSGQKKIKMADLRNLLTDTEFEDVETYIQSGNIILKSSNNDKREISNKISEAIRSHYNFDVKVLTLAHSDFDYILNNNPFLNDRSEDINRLYLTFLFNKPGKDAVIPNQDKYKPEEFHLDGTYLYFFSPLGYGRASMNNNFWEKQLGVAATTRNWKTVVKLFELSK